MQGHVPRVCILEMASSHVHPVLLVAIKIKLEQTSAISATMGGLHPSLEQHLQTSAVSRENC